MKTATEIRTAEAAVISRAVEFEKQTNMERSLVVAIDRLERQQQEHAAHLAPLEAILALAPKIPEGLTTRGTNLGRGGIAGGFDVRHVVTTAIASAIEDTTRRLAEIDETLVKARKHLARARAALKEFD